MDFSALRDIFIGRLDADYCVKALLSLKSPKNAKEYLIHVHEVDRLERARKNLNKDERWKTYPHVNGAPNVSPIRDCDLSSSEFTSEQANKLSFDISRFTEFLAGYTQVDEDIKPIMLHYGMIYLFDFFSRTWLKYQRNWNHGIHLTPCSTDYCVRIDKAGIFPRAVDAFYLLNQSSLFSVDDDDGMGYPLNLKGKPLIEKIDKMRYSECPKISLVHLLDVYKNIGKIKTSVEKSNHILVGYVILFIVSSISRYRAEDWFKIRENRDMKNEIELLQYDFLYEWTPELLKQTILKKGLELSIPHAE